MTALPRGSVLGILGGGQLGRMTALAAYPLGYEVHVFNPTPGPATQVTPHVTLAAWDDEEALAAFAEHVDVVTYEFENVPAHTAAFLQARVPVRPGPNALHVAQHRAREKGFLNEHGVPTTAWAEAFGPDDVEALKVSLGTPYVLKTSRFGYDGKGQTVVRAETDPAEAWAAIAGEREGVEAIGEAFVDFAYEASVVVARGVGGDVAAFDLVENRHEDHVLAETHAPADAPDAVRAEARRLAGVIVEALDYVGVMGVELFVTHDDRLMVNELAPRPHNSGHWTQDGAVTSQFEQCVRAAMGLPLGSPDTRVPTVMRNLLGDEIDTLHALAAEPNVKVHDYGKAEARPGRKMAHVNRLKG